MSHLNRGVSITFIDICVRSGSHKLHKREICVISLEDPVTALIEKLTLKVLVTTIDAQWEGMGDVGSVRYEPALLPPCPTIRVLSYSN